MKVLKFRKILSELILTHKKNTTWRLFDDKNISVDDLVSLVVWETGKEFATARITSVIEKPFCELPPDAFEGHEIFFSEKELLETYKEYYKTEINQSTPFKVIKFEVL